MERIQNEASAQARTIVKDMLGRTLEGQIQEFTEKKDEDAKSQRAKVATAAEEIFERFPRRRYMNREQKREN